MPASLDTIKLRRRLAIELLALVTLVATTIAALYDAGRAREYAEQTARVDAELQAQALQGALDRFRGLPEMWSKEPSLISALQGQDAAELSQRGLQLTYLSGAWATGFFNPDGELLAWADRSSNTPILTRLPTSIHEAVQQQRLGRLWVDQSPRPLYGFASGVSDLGSIVVFVDLSAIQEQWGLLNHPVLVVDSANKVLLSNEAGWLSRGLQSLPLERGWVSVERRLPALDWRLLSVHQVDLARLWVVVALGLASGIVIWGILSRFFRRQMTEHQDARLQQATALRLERLVKSRTRDLERAQESQIQTAKLAAIGQMSTTLTHEYNQPIATIQTYAENAQRFLQRGQVDAVGDNLEQILKQAERMGLLSKTLLTFARRPGAELSALSWQQHLDEALVLLRTRFEGQGVKLIRPTLSDEVLIWAGPVRLTQVWVNLLSNALDALRDTNDPQIVIYFESGQDEVKVWVCDNGPGIASALIGQLFEPFVTTKPAGSGLGLGLPLARDLMRQFGGDLTVEPADQGARFCLCFQRPPVHPSSPATPVERNTL